MWSAAKILVCVGVSAGCGVQILKNKTADAENCGEPLHEDDLRQCPYLYWDWNWDRRAALKKRKDRQLPEIDEKQNSTYTHHIICVASGLCFKTEGSTLCGLQREGRLQILNLINALKRTEKPFRNIYCSSLKQDRETAEMIHDGLSANSKVSLNLISDAMLVEGPTVVPIPLSSSGLPSPVSLFTDQIKIEAAFRQRFYRLSKSDKEDMYDIIVAQPDVIKYFICRALQLPPEALSRFHLNWASITWFSIAGNGIVTALSIGDSGLQPPTLLAAK